MKKIFIFLAVSTSLVMAKPKWESYGLEDGMVHYVNVNKIKYSNKNNLVDLDIRYHEIEDEPTDIHLTISCTERIYVDSETKRAWTTKGSLMDTLWKTYCIDKLKSKK
jgi:hypothetical protein